MANIIYTRGGTLGVDSASLVDGQILFDREAKRIFLDVTVNGTLTRIAMKEGTFNGTAAQWEALTDAQKEVFTYVNITDDYVPGVAGHTIQNSSGTAFVSRRNLKFMNATVTDDSVNNATIVTPAGGGDAADIDYDNTTSGLVADDVQNAIDELVTNISDIVPTYKNATLSAGSTTVSFTNLPTSGTLLYTLFSSSPTLEYEEVDDSTAGTLTYTFEEQESAVDLVLKLEGVIGS